MKVVINACFGGFSLSPAATLWLWLNGCKGVEATHVDEYWPPEKREEEARRYPTMGYDASLTKWREYLAAGPSGKRDSHFLCVFSPDEKYVLTTRSIPRDDPLLLKVIEELGDGADGACASLRAVEIPDDVKWQIEEYDGNEHVAEVHQTWS